MPDSRLAFIGDPGAMSPWLFTAIRRYALFDAVCTADPDRDMRRYQARWAFTDPQSLLRESEPQGVILAAPMRDRLRLAKMCVAAGAGVLVMGAPCAASACRRLALYAQLSCRCIEAAAPLRRAPALLLARRLIESGRFGRPISISLTSTRRGASVAEADGAGLVSIDQTFETLDLLHSLVGPLDRVAAFAQEDGVLNACGLTRSGVVVSLVLHAGGSMESVGTTMEMRSADGTVLQLDRNCRLWCGNGTRTDAAHSPTLAAADPATELGYDGLVGEFVRVLRSGRSAGLLAGAANVAASAEAVHAAAARSRIIPVKPVGSAEQSNSTIPEATWVLS